MRTRILVVLAAPVAAALFAGAVTSLWPTGGPDGGSGDRGDEGPAVVLNGQGIGAFGFGADPDQVLAGLTLRWGPPDDDSGWIPAASSPYGVCPGTVVRGVNWRGFSVLFSDGATPWAPAGTRHFFRWEFRPDDPPRPGPEVRVDPAAAGPPGVPLVGGGACGR